jgi:hypothetical protein
MRDHAPTLTLRTLLFFVLSIGAVAVLGAYLIFQARFLILGPQITLEPNHIGRVNQPVVTLRGEARNITRLWLNDRPIFTDRTGRFEEALVLENGYTIATLTAEDRYGRRTALYREFVYVPATIVR